MEGEADDIIDVWADNLEEEMIKISKLIEKYPFIGMDTEFSGFLVKTANSFNATEEQKYHTLMQNTNMLKLIQIGITIGDKKGEVPKPVCTWQFNFRFNLSTDLQGPDSINLLRQAGIDFDKFYRDGIEMSDFAAMFFASGMIMNEHIIWITFQHGYDLSYLVKLVSAQPLPKTKAEYDHLRDIIFPHFYDLRHIIIQQVSSCGSLQDLAKEMQVERRGSMHQAGSDSYVTLLAYYAAMRKFFDGNYTNETFRNKG